METLNGCVTTQTHSRDQIPALTYASVNEMRQTGTTEQLRDIDQTFNRLVVRYHLTNTSAQRQPDHEPQELAATGSFIAGRGRAPTCLFASQLIFTTFPTRGSGMEHSGDMELAIGGSAHNRAMVEFCSGDRGCSTLYVLLADLDRAGEWPRGDRNGTAVLLIASGCPNHAEPHRAGLGSRRQATLANRVPSAAPVS